MGTFLYLKQARVFSALLLLFALCVSAYVGYELFLNGASEEGVVFWLFTSPLASGTGLLTLSRAGNLDLLFGASVSRRRAFGTAFVGVVGVVVLLAAIFGALSAHDALRWSCAARAAGTAFFVSSVCFAVGVAEPRYAMGVAWFALRFVALTTHAGFLVYHQLAAVKLGGSMPPFRSVLLLAVAFPEVMLRPEVPIAIVLVGVSIGALAAIVALIVFSRAEFPGKRSS